MNHQQIAERLIVELQDAKLIADESNWPVYQQTLAEHLREAGHGGQADFMAGAVTLDDFRGTCAEVALDVLESAWPQTSRRMVSYFTPEGM